MYGTAFRDGDSAFIGTMFARPHCTLKQGAPHSGAFL